MRTHFLLLIALTTLTLSSCGATSGSPKNTDDHGSPALQEMAGESPPQIPESLSSAYLAGLSFTLLDRTVRTALTKSGLNFNIRLQDGWYTFPPLMAGQGYQKVQADLEHVAYGDLNGDTIPDAVIPIFTHRGDSAILELAAVTDSGSTAFHFASFPIGVAVLNSLHITDGKIRVNFIHEVPGDPGPRNTALTLELPKR